MQENDLYFLCLNDLFIVLEPIFTTASQPVWILETTFQIRSRDKHLHEKKTSMLLYEAKTNFTAELQFLLRSTDRHLCQLELFWKLHTAKILTKTYPRCNHYHIKAVNTLLEAFNNSKQKERSRSCLGCQLYLSVYKPMLVNNFKSTYIVSKILECVIILKYVHNFFSIPLFNRQILMLFLLSVAQTE